MKSRILTPLIIMAILIIPLAGCVTDDSQSNITPLATDLNNLKATVAQHSTEIAQVREEVGRKADSSRVDSLATSIGQSGGSNCYPKSETYSKAEVDAAIASAINNLKANQSWINSNSGSGSGSVSDTGTVIFTNNPVSIPQLFSSSSGAASTPWIMTIKNNSTTWQYVKPVVQLNVASGQSSTTVTDITLLISGGACTMTGSLTAPGNMSFSPANMSPTTTPSIVIIPISGCNNNSGEIQIGPGQTQALNIQIQNLKTPNATLWNVTTSISSRSM